MSLEKIKQELAAIAGWKYATKEEAQKVGKCIQCGEDAAPRCHTPAGKREYKISGLCEDCWDLIFKDE